jgi:hypothetical protein
MAQSAFMKKLRDKMGIIFLVTAVLFIAMMVFQWGMDITGRTSPKKSESVVGSTLGEDIDIKEYSDEWKKQEQNFYRNNINVDEFTRAEIREQSWQELINRIILGKEFQLKNTKNVTGIEIYERLSVNPPEWLKNNQQFHTNGKFDYDKYLRVLNDPAFAKEWLPAEQLIASNLPTEKTRTLIETMTYVVLYEVMDQHFFNETEIEGEFLIFGPDCLGSHRVDTSEIALKSYYSKNKNKLPKDPYAIYSYLRIPFHPSKSDTEEALSTTEMLYEKLIKGEDFAYLAEGYSMDRQSAVKGGDIGFIKAEQALPELAAVITKLDSGELSEPILTLNGYHLINLLQDTILEDTINNSVDTFYHIQHILIRIEPGYETRESLEVYTKNIIDYTRKYGLNAASKKYGLEIHNTGKVGIIEPIPGIGLRTLVNQFAFKEGVGSVPDIVRGNIDYFVIHVDYVTPAKLETFEDYIPVIKNEIIEEAKKSVCRNIAYHAYEMLKTGKSMKEVSVDFGVKYGTIDSVSPSIIFSDTSANPWIIGALAGVSTPDSISAPLEGTDGRFYIVRINNRTMPNYDNFNEISPPLRREIFSARQNTAYDSWFISLRRRIPIYDNRLNFIDIGQAEMEHEPEPGDSAS